MKLDQTIKTIISMSNIDQFTVIEIRTAYLALKCDESLNAAKVRAFVYAELQRLTRNGWLRISQSEKRKITSYTKTCLFNAEELETTNESGNCFDTSILSEIKKEIVVCNAELLECLGALETYVALSEKHPKVKSVLKKGYIAAQERNHILRGKIKAMNSLLKIIDEK